MKTCSKCKLEKLESEFYKNPRSKYLLNYSCKTCFKNLVRKRSVFLNSTKPKRINKTDNPNYKKEYIIKNKELLKEKRKIYYKKNKDKLLANNKKYYEKNKKYINRKNNLLKKKKDSECSLRKSKARISDLIRKSIKKNGYTKRSRTFHILGCDFLFFKEYIESQFKNGMKWDNIHLDHIKPISTATTEKEVLELNHYTNFQPLFVKDNLSKSNKLIEKQLRIL
jgi:hypothetical protein